MTLAIGRRLAASLLLVLVAAGSPPAAAAEPDLSTPDLAARSFLQAFAAQDVTRMLAISSAADEAVGFRFADSIKRMGAFEPYNGLVPAEHPLYAAINRSTLESRLLRQSFLLAWSLLTDPRPGSFVIPMSDAQADFLEQDLDPSPLAGLRVLDSRFPDATYETHERVREEFLVTATLRGADDFTERLVLVEVDDRQYEIGLGLFLYGGSWKVSSIDSILGHTDPGIARPTTPELYDRHTSGDYSDLE